jgi:hypothetical protein
LDTGSAILSVRSDVLGAKARRRATIAAGNPLSQSQLHERFPLTRSQASKLRREAIAESNGQKAITT